MKFKLVAVFAILLIVTLGHCRLARSGQVVKNSYEDTFPNIDGNYLVWQGNVNGDWEIFLYNINDKELYQITDNDHGDVSPQIDGDYVVWLGFSRSGGEIFLYDISSGETIQITNDSNVDSPPQIANGRVVWTSCEVTNSVEPGEIFLYDVAAKAKTCLSASVDPDRTLDDSFPRINDESVIWVQADDAGNTTLFIHYFGNGTGPAPQGFVWQDSPQTDGDLTVLTRHDGNDREIFVYDSSLRTYEQITDNDFEDRYPCISGNNIAWVGGEGKASEIFINSNIEPIEPPQIEPPQSGSSWSTDDDDGLCFVATAAFGSYMHPHVQVIRDFRDKYLLTNMPGRWFVGKYNTYGPFWADFLNAHPRCKPFVRLALMPMVGMSYFTLKTSLVTKLLTGFLLMGLVVICFLRIRSRSV